MDIIKELIAQGADVNKRDNAGKTALTYAIKGGNQDLVKIIKAAGGKA